MYLYTGDPGEGDLGRGTLGRGTWGEGPWGGELGKRGLGRWDPGEAEVVIRYVSEMCHVRDDPISPVLGRLTVHYEYNVQGIDNAWSLYTQPRVSE